MSFPKARIWGLRIIILFPSVLDLSEGNSPTGVRTPLLRGRKSCTLAITPWRLPPSAFFVLQKKTAGYTRIITVLLLNTCCIKSTH